jgi:hypothetical protein
MSRFLLVCFCLGLTACGPPKDQFGYQGFAMNEFFPFDGPRTWKFINEDDKIPYLLVGKLNEEYETTNGGDTRIFEIEFSKDCFRDDADCVEEEYVRTWWWSYDGTNGTLLHGNKLKGESEDLFDPPVSITSPNMKKDEFVETETAGGAWTSTFVNVEECPVQWEVNWDDCVLLDVDDGDGDPSTGNPASGTFWAVKDYNIVAFDVPGEPGRWELLKHLQE